ncbi:MFS transporter [Bacillus cytotoxicus]|uniref:MFS transporter n=1 Tax=Bacillus cytotoxicus TaxID=580165 RepID=A0ACC6A830_9BACI|nr:MFS transporter [Bacillus cytotoxicus]
MNFLFVFAFYLVEVEKMSELQAGTIISTLAIVSMAVTAIMTPIATKRGSTAIGCIGIFAFLIASYLFGHMSLNFTNWDYVWRLMIVGIGTGCTLAPLTTTAVLSVPIEKSGIASSVSNISRTVGSIVGVAVLVVILNHQLSIEKEKVKIEAEKIICESNQTSLQKEKMIRELKLLTMQQNVMKDAGENNKFYKQIQVKYKHAVLESFNQTFQMGGIIFLFAFLSLGIEIYMKRREKDIKIVMQS